MTADGTNMAFTYDNWGRMSTRAMAGHTATFDYRFGNKLKSATSNFPNEAASENLNYDGLGKLRYVQDDSGATWLRWDGWKQHGFYNGTTGSWNVGDLFLRFAHDPSSTGGAPLATTFVDPVFGDIPLNVERDRLGSLRRTRFEGTPLTQREYGPYGESYSVNGQDLFFGYTGHGLFNAASDYPLYYAPYRMYSPDSARWTTRDPLGMVDGPNEYGYVGENPILSTDPLGLYDLTSWRFWYCVLCSIFFVPGPDEDASVGATFWTATGSYLAWAAKRLSALNLYIGIALGMWGGFQIGDKCGAEEDRGTPPPHDWEGFGAPAGGSGGGRCK